MSKGIELLELQQSHETYSFVRLCQLIKVSIGTDKIRMDNFDSVLIRIFLFFFILI